jgi:tRNA pseudouridine55 synthase
MISGILLIDKPEGLSSFDVVRRVRRLLEERKIGHLGTLDPFATGLLPLCLGEATKLVPYLMPGAKTYRATIKLGAATDTQDLTGRVVSRTETWPSPEQIYQAAARFVGEIQQVPPMHSALHYQGERLYKLARRGETVALAPRPVTIYRLEVEEIDLPQVTITVQCSQGTYIRTLAADLGASLGCGAHLTALRRLAVGSFLVSDALGLAALEEAAPEVCLTRIIPLTACLPGMRQVRVGPEAAGKLRRGQAVAWPDEGFQPEELVQVLTAGEMLAVARVRCQETRVVLSPVRVFADNQGSGARDQGSEKPPTAVNSGN